MIRNPKTMSGLILPGHLIKMKSVVATLSYKQTSLLVNSSVFLLDKSCLAIISSVIIVLAYLK
jgi:hypothetical protein